MLHKCRRIHKESERTFNKARKTDSTTICTSRECVQQRHTYKATSKRHDRTCSMCCMCIFEIESKRRYVKKEHIIIDYTSRITRVRSKSSQASRRTKMASNPNKPSNKNNTTIAIKAFCPNHHKVRYSINAFAVQ